MRCLHAALFEHFRAENASSGFRFLQSLPLSFGSTGFLHSWPVRRWLSSARRHALFSSRLFLPLPCHHQAASACLPPPLAIALPKRQRPVPPCRCCLCWSRLAGAGIAMPPVQAASGRQHASFRFRLHRQPPVVSTNRHPSPLSEHVHFLHVSSYSPLRSAQFHQRYVAHSLFRHLTMSSFIRHAFLHATTTGPTAAFAHRRFPD